MQQLLWFRSCSCASVVKSQNNRQMVCTNGANDEWHQYTLVVGEERHQRECRGPLPSKGVRLEPPFFPSSPCCEYCFRRFWALRMVPGPIQTKTQSRGREVQIAKRKRKDEKEGEKRKRGRRKRGALESEWWRTDTTSLHHWNESPERGAWGGEPMGTMATSTPTTQHNYGDRATTAQLYKIKLNVFMCVCVSEHTTASR